jgi:hypothetical protein
VFALSTTGIIGTNALRFLKEVCGIDDKAPAGADPESAMAMRRITTALSCATATVRGGALWDAVNLYGYSEPPTFHLTKSCTIPTRRRSETGVPGARHPSNALRNPGTGSGRLDERVFTYTSPFDALISPPSTQLPAPNLLTPPAR